ncbi:MAG: tetratricopeptide repeat protein [bacterium]|nr:tetratricopeptide repeat protein [bacterium]
MGMFQELRARRVIPFVSAYVVGSWGLVQFVAFLEGRLMLSPHLVNLLAVGLVTLLPSIVVMAWCHGRPGADRWGRTEKVSIPVNMVAAAVLLFVLFDDKDLGAVTETVEVRDEHGAVSERVVPKSQYRHRALVYYFENEGDPADEWLRQGLAVALLVDLNQDPWLDGEDLTTRAATLRREGYPDGLGLPRPLMRKIARNTHVPHFVTGSFARGPEGITLDLSIHDTETGRMTDLRQLGPAPLFDVVDEASVLLRQELGLPASHLETQTDLPAADVLTADPEALRGFIEGMTELIHANDWQSAGPPLERAVELDPGFAMAHFLRYAVLATNGDEEASYASMRQAMANLYRLSERSQFQVKAIYYFNVEQDPDKSQAILDMWTRIYPNDVAAYGQVAMFARFRGDDAGTVAALERILEIDPTRYEILTSLADHHGERGRRKEAADLYERYAADHPNDARSFTQMATLHTEFGDLDQARSSLEQALLIAPDRTGTRRQLAGLDIRLGRFDEADKTLALLLEQADNDEDRRPLSGDLIDLHTIQGRWRLARRELKAWGDLARATVNPSQVYLAHAFKLPGVTSAAWADSALAGMQELRALAGPPNDSMMGMCEAQVLALQRRHQEATAALAESDAMVREYKLEAIRPLLLQVEGSLAEARGDLDAARDLHAQASELNPTGRRHLLDLGRVQRLTGEDGDASRTLGKALALSPGHPEINLELALLATDRGRHEEARTHLAKALAGWRQADPDHPGAMQAQELSQRLDAIQ